MEVSSNLYCKGRLIRAHPEDIAISVWYRSLFISEGINFAPVELARSFAFEGGDDKYINQFGFYGFYSNILDWFGEKNSRESIYNMYLEYQRKLKPSWKPDQNLQKNKYDF